MIRCRVSLLRLPGEGACEEIRRHSSARLPGGSRGPLLRGTNLSSMGKALRLLGKLGAMEGWIPACAGKTSNGLRHRDTRTPFLHTLAGRNLSPPWAPSFAGVTKCAVPARRERI